MDERANQETAGETKRLAHDLLQSVAIIQAMVAVTRVGADDPDRVRESLTVIEREAAVIGHLCQLQMAGPPAHLPLDVAAIAERAVVRMQALYTGELALELAAQSGPRISGDEVEWERSLVNLIENACRAAGPDGKVLVRCSSNAEAVLLGVSDSGPGFGEASSGRSSLGMVTVMRLVERYGGHLELRRSQLGGAKLTMVFPHPANAQR